MNYDDFTTKDSGEREEYASGMRRDVQTGKPRFDLFIAVGVPYAAQLFTRVAGLLSRGADKYGDRNHELASGDEELERFKASALRHMVQYVTGETDEDHAAAVVFNLFAAESLKSRRDVAEVLVPPGDHTAGQTRATAERLGLVEKQEDDVRAPKQGPTAFEEFQKRVQDSAEKREQEKLCSICRKPRGTCRLHIPFETPAGQTLTFSELWPVGNLTAYDLKEIYGYTYEEARNMTKEAKRVKEESRHGTKA